MKANRALLSGLAVAGIGLAALLPELSVPLRAASPTDAGSAGEQAYQSNCAACHGVNLGGGFGPPLSGPEFKQRWGAQKAGLLQFIASQMPPKAPGALDDGTYRAITRFIQQRSGLPSDASGALPPQSAQKSGEASNDADDHGGVPNRDSDYRKEIGRRGDLAAGLTAVSDSYLENPSAGDWPMWRRDFSETGYSPLDDITKTNVSKLHLAWSLALTPGTNELTPLAYQGVIFVNSNGVIQAIEGATGDLLWQFSRPSKRGDPVTQPRGMALHGDRLFVATDDSHVIALDIHDGRVAWDHAIAAPSGKPQLTAGPIVVRGKVIQGVSGCSGTDIVGGCYVVGLDEASGREIWRFKTIPRPGERDGDSWNGAPVTQRFGASVWSTPSYDPKLNLIFVGTSNTYNIGPLLNPRRPISPANAALYTNTTLALDPDTGKLVWHYQHFMRDVWNLDWAFEQTLVDLPTPSGDRRAVVTVGKIGIMDILDARTGTYIASYDYGLQNLVGRIDPRTGTKFLRPEMEPVPGGSQLVCPYAGGARNWYASAYDPTSHRLYLPLVEACMNYHGEPKEGTPGLRLELVPPPGHDGNFGRVSAVDLVSLKPAWRERYRSPQVSAILATAGHVLFEGGRDRVFRALDSDSGATLWSARLDSIINSFPITFTVGGQQYVAVTTGGGGLLDGTLRVLTPETKDPPQVTTLWVFTLGDGAAGH
jgi:alcohol dehydrogenase (cytochrome c)